MRVTSLIGGTTRREGPGESPPPEHLAWVEVSRKARPVEPGAGRSGWRAGSADQYPSRLGPNPRLFWHPEPSRGQLSSDVGLLPAGRFNRGIGLPRELANAVAGPRDPARIEHPFPGMARARVY